ncbi:MAG: cupin domain-containing protein [Bacteroidales bacterium]|nr:cupin domain-containing protein [Bacteroidales bacterium]
MKNTNVVRVRFLILMLALPLVGIAQNNEESTNLREKEFNIENCVNKFDMDKTIKTSVGYQYWFVDKDFIDGRTLKMSVVAPHEATHEPHKHVEDEFFFVLEGTARFYLEGKTTIDGPLTSFYCPAFMEHGISNIGDTELKYLVIKKYPKQDLNSLNK